MEPNMAQYQTKIKQLLEKFLDPSYQIKNDVYLNRLLTHISGKEKAEVESTLIRLPIFSEWLSQAVTTWESNSITPSNNIASFTLNLTCLLSKNEDKFNCLNDNDLYRRLISVLRCRQPDVAPSIKLGYIRLIHSFLEHKSGIEWVMESNLWEDILNFSLSNQTLYITREGHRFMSKILEKTIDTNEQFCNGVIKRIMTPISENSLQSIKANENSMEISDEVAHQNLSPTLQLIGNILEYFLESALFAQKDFRIVLIFLKNFHLEQRICNFMMIAQNKYLVFDLGKIMFIMQFLELYVNVVMQNLQVADVQSAVRKIMSIFNTNISKGNFENVMKFCYFGQFYWNLMGYKIPCMKVNKENEPISFANQLIVLQMLPVFCVTGKYCYDNNIAQMEKSDDIEFRDRFIGRLFKMMCENTVRIAYSWRNFLMNQANLFEIGTKALTYIMKSRKYYPRERAAIVFQCFIYSFKDIMTCLKECPEKVETFAKEVQYMSLLLDALAVFIEEFQITWRDSVETICVMSVAFDFLSMPMWPSQLVVKGLKLVNISIAKYMTPNMALLIDQLNGSTMALMGPLLYAKLHDGAWEVRDSTLEVVHTISHFSSSKFPSLQRVLIESEHPGLIVKMSACDGEYFVRATAIRCLQEMIKVEEIWNNSLKKEHLPEKMTQILLNETEGIVRVEAASLMCVAYEQQKFTSNMMEKIYEIMIHAATTDLHWEVKVRALGFWEHVIKDHLQNQGMIDDSFPSVTFSKENRKIVTLTDSEIRKRLQKVLQQLSTIGCLGVLMSAIKDDCDMEVSKTAVKITQTLVKLLKTYKIQSEFSVPTSPIDNGTSSAMSFSSGISTMGDESQGSPPNGMNTLDQFNDEIIDQIVNSRDISLLSDVYSPSDYGSVINYEVQVKKIVSPSDFLHFTRQDLESIITEKRNWLNGIEDFGSLLDDMLKTYSDNINNMDCY